MLTFAAAAFGFPTMSGFAFRFMAGMMAGAMLRAGAIARARASARTGAFTTWTSRFATWTFAYYNVFIAGLTGALLVFITKKTESCWNYNFFWWSYSNFLTMSGFFLFLTKKMIFFNLFKDKIRNSPSTVFKSMTTATTTTKKTSLNILVQQKWLINYGIDSLNDLLVDRLGFYSCWSTIFVY